MGCSNENRKDQYHAASAITIALADCLFGLAHELESRYGDDIYSQQQAARNQLETNDRTDTDKKCDL